MEFLMDHRKKQVLSTSNANIFLQEKYTMLLKISF